MLYGIIEVSLGLLAYRYEKSALDLLMQGLPTVVTYSLVLELEGSLHCYHRILYQT